MDEFVTPYEDDDAQFIECKVCEKSIRGETLYKIHLTSPGHLKKEDALVAVGHAVQQQNIPVFEDILHYLDYMKLDEPIIGLDFLRELSNNDPQGDPRYTCSLCNQTAHLTEMVRHLIGRKHRQKYMETKRPELVTWNKRESQGGKIFKAKAEMIERQDGRGHPVLMPKRSKDNRFHTSGGQTWQMQNRNNKGSLIPQDVPPYHPRLNFKIECDQTGGYAPQQPNTSSFNHADAYTLNQDQRDTHGQGHFEDNVWKTDQGERDGCRQARGDSDYGTNYEERYGQDEQRAFEFEPRKYETRSEVPRVQSRSSSQEEFYTEETPYRRGYSERNPMDIFQTGEIRNEQDPSPDYKLFQQSNDSDPWSWDRRQGSREPVSTRSFLTGPGSDQSHDLQDHYIGESYTKEANAGPSRPGLRNLERREDVPRFMSDIPEPFRRFLKGGTNDGEQGKRKRKSRFSDASIEEVVKTRRMFEEYGPSELKFGSYHSTDRPLARPDIHGIQHSGPIQGPHHNESYHRGRGGGGSEKEVVFDMLKNIEIENKEEADFLKRKLCELLKEFKAKKSGRAENDSSRSFISKDFNSLSSDNSFHTRHMYEQVDRENSDYRQQENPNYHKNHRESLWEHRGQNIPEDQHQGYSHSMRADSRYPNSNHNQREGGFVQSEMSSRQRGIHLSDSPSYPQRSLEPMYSHGNEEYLDFRSSAPSHHVERESRLERSVLYSSNLEKITSTLLELVRRQ